MTAASLATLAVGIARNLVPRPRRLRRRLHALADVHLHPDRVLRQLRGPEWDNTVVELTVAWTLTS